ncbi:MAG: tetratricopeptide repeat protein, partial [Gammaproteobacteria bacterium]
ELAMTAGGAALAALYAEELKAAAELAKRAIEAGARDPSTTKGVAVARIVESIVSLRLGQLEKATQTSDETLESVSSRLGVRHEAFIDVTQLVGGLWHRNGQPVQAVRYLEQALTAATDALGVGHAKTVNIALDLIRSRLAAGQRDEAVAALSQLSVSSEANPLLNAKFQRTQALMAAASNDYAAAIELMMDANEITEQVLGPKHLTHALGIVQLSGLQVENGQASEAEPALRRALSTLEGSLGKNHVSLTPTLGYLGSANVALGRIGSAASYFDRQLKSLENAFGKTSGRLEPVLINLAELQVRTNQMKNAIVNLRRAVEITRNEDQGLSTVRVANASARLAAALIHIEQFAEANALYGEALEVYDRELEADDPRVVETLRSLAALSLLQGDHEAAHKLMDRVPASG